MASWPSTRRSGYRVGLCDLTRPARWAATVASDERLAEAEAARAVLGAAWRVNLRLPDRALGRDARTRAGCRLTGPPGAASRGGRPDWTIDIPTTSPPAGCWSEAVFSAGPAPYAPTARRGRPTGSVTYFINDSVVTVVRRRRSARLRREAASAGLSRDAVRARGRRPGGDAAAASTFQQLIESRDCPFRGGGRRRVRGRRAMVRGTCSVTRPAGSGDLSESRDPLLRLGRRQRRRGD